MRGRVLIADDEDSILRTMGAVLERDGYSVVAACTGTGAIRLLAAQPLDVAIVDLHLGDVPGLEIVSYLRQHAPGALAIILTGYASTESAIEALRLGAYDYLTKPTDAYALLATVARAMERRRLELRVAEQTAEIEAANKTIRALNADLERRVDEATSALQQPRRAACDTGTGDQHPSSHEVNLELLRNARRSPSHPCEAASFPRLKR